MAIVLHFVAQVPQDIPPPMPKSRDCRFCSVTCWRWANGKPPKLRNDSPRFSGVSVDTTSTPLIPSNHLQIIWLTFSSAPRAHSRSRPKLELKLWPLIRNKVLGVCHFGSFYEAMDAAQHLVTLKPIAVELIDRTMIGLGRDYRHVPHRHRSDSCAAIRTPCLPVEFAEDDQAENLARLHRLGDLMGDPRFRLGRAAATLGWRGRGARSCPCRPASLISAPPVST